MAGAQVDHYIPFFGRDFYASTAMWTAAEVGHYIRLLVIQWDSGHLPADLERLELISPGISAVWGLLQTKFPLGDDGQRRNVRMEEHRAKAQELKAKRAKSGRSGGSKSQANRQQTGKQNASKPQANGQAKTKPPSPSPSPSSSLREEEHTHRTRESGDDFGQPGWAAEEWDRFVAAWNATQRAAKWTPLMAPSGWVDLAASPGWLDRARQAMARLPACRYFDDPLAVTKFFEFVDRILAGEFDNPKKSRGYGQGDAKAGPQPTDQTKRRYFRSDAGKNMSDAEYGIWRREQRNGGMVAALAGNVKLKEQDL